MIRAVDEISFSVRRGEVLGIVGKSGCGKSTAARLMMNLIQPDEGEVLFEGNAIGAPTLPLKAFRRQAQMVFQDSHSSLNPRLSVIDTIAFGLLAHGATRRAAEMRSRNTLADVGLEPDRFANVFPHELSGGQRQRVNIARALALEPRLIIFDEAVSALDKSVEAQVLSLIGELKQRLALTYVFISHDLNVINFLCDRVMVMYLGKVVEIGRVDEVYPRPRPSLYAGALRLAADLRPEAAHQGRAARRRSAERCRSAFGMPLSDPLPAGACQFAQRSSRHSGRSPRERSQGRLPFRRLACQRPASQD